MKWPCSIIFTLLSLVVVLAGSVHATLITNGDFEEGSLDEWMSYGLYSANLDSLSLSGSEAFLSFELREGSDWYLCSTVSVQGIDDVSVTAAPVPEPSTMMLIGVGLISTGLYHRIRTREIRS